MTTRSAEHMDRYASKDPSPEDELIACEESDPDGEGPRSLSNFAMRQAIKLLPRREREALLLWYDRVPQREIAERQGVTQPAVHGRIKKAVRRLRWILRVRRTFDDATVERMARAIPREDVNVLVVWSGEGSSTAVARVMSLEARDARRLCARALSKLVVAAREDAELAPVVEAFRVLAQQKADLSRRTYDAAAPNGRKRRTG